MYKKPEAFLAYLIHHSQDVQQWRKSLYALRIHPVKMVQLWLNMGPRHVLGWAKSFTKALDQKTLISHDEDAVGAISIVWSLI